MGVFVLLDESGRLVQVMESASGDFGLSDPYAQFFEKQDPRRTTHAAFEIAPEILLQVRPAVFRSLIGMARRVDGELVVDEIQDIRERLRRQQIEALEAVAFRAAQGLGVSDLATSRWWPGGELPEHLQRQVAALRAELEAAWKEAEELRAGRLLPVPNQLAALAGQRVPL